MYPLQRFVSFILRRLYTHNPFYLISVALVLCGLHRSFSGAISASQGMLLTQLFCGYVLLLAAVGVLVIRLGKVWEDGRMILLIILLLFVALSMSFDEIALNDPLAGGKCLAIGFGFAALMTESILWLLRLRLPAYYRVPYYLQLAVLFAYPYQLSVWSEAANDPRMPWGVLLFPAVCAVALLTLWPAAHRAGRSEPDNGSPWPWPLYPWTIFFFLTLGMTLRTYSVTMVFEAAKGGANGFMPFFLIPLLLAVSLLVLEMGLMRRRTWTVHLALAAAAAALGLTFFQPTAGPVQTKYFAMLQTTVGAPPFLTTWLLVGFYAFALLRGVRWAEAGLLVGLLLASLTAPNSTTPFALADYWFLPHAVIVIYQLAIGLARRCTWRLLMASFLFLADATYLLRDTWLLDHRAILPLHAALMAVLLVPLFLSDWLARWLKRVAPWILSFAALLAAAYYPRAFPSAPTGWHLEYLTLLVAVAAVYWLQLRNWRSVAAVAACLAAYAGFSARVSYSWLREQQLLKGLDWLAWGLACLAMAAMISTLKGGGYRYLRLRLRRWQRQAQPTAPPQDAA